MKGVEANGVPRLLLDHMSNLSFEKIVELFHQGIKVDYNNDPNPEKFPQARSITAGNITSLNWKWEGIICTWIAKHSYINFINC